MLHVHEIFCDPRENGLCHNNNNIVITIAKLFSFGFRFSVGVFHLREKSRTIHANAFENEENRCTEEIAILDLSLSIE